MKRLWFFLLLMLLSQGLILSQELMKNELTLNVGTSIPTSGDLYADEGEYHRVFYAKQNGATYQLSYSRFLTKSFALRFSYRHAAFMGIRDNNSHYDFSGFVPHSIGTHAIDAGICYYYDVGEKMSLYIGGGINFMTTKTNEDKWFKPNYHSAEVIKPLTHISPGLFAISGISLKLSKNVSLKIEEEYVYNGFTVSRWNYHGGKVASIYEEGRKVIRINPLTTLAGISFRW